MMPLIIIPAKDDRFKEGTFNLFHQAFGSKLDPQSIKSLTEDHVNYSVMLESIRQEHPIVCAYDSDANLAFPKFVQHEDGVTYSSPHALYRAIEEHEYAVISQNVDQVKLVDCGYETCLMEGSDLQEHFKTRRRVAGSLSRFRSLQEDYFLKKVSRSEIDMDLYRQASAFTLARFFADSKAYMKVHYHYTVHNFVDSIVDAYAFQRMSDGQTMGFVFCASYNGWYSWLETIFHPDYYDLYRNLKLGSFIVNSVFALAIEKNMVCDIGIEMEYKKLWKVRKSWIQGIR